MLEIINTDNKDKDRDRSLNFAWQLCGFYLLVCIHLSIFCFFVFFDMGDLVMLFSFGCDGVEWGWMGLNDGSALLGIQDSGFGGGLEGWRELGLDER